MDCLMRRHRLCLENSLLIASAYSVAQQLSRQNTMEMHFSYTIRFEFKLSDKANMLVCEYFPAMNFEASSSRFFGRSNKR